MSSAPKPAPSRAKAWAAFAYALVSYVAFHASFLYLILFLANVLVPKGVDEGILRPVPVALAINAALILLWSLQHTVMARPAFKRRWITVVGELHERSTYVLASALALGIVFWGWSPVPEFVWYVESPALRIALWSLLGIGSGVALISSFLINHAELFGLQQSWRAARGLPARDEEFRTPGFYRFVRHPLQTGVLLMIWATPEMSVGHLSFSVGMTIYILVGLHYEERDLLRIFGEDYRRYQQRVPKLLPHRRPR